MKPFISTIFFLSFLFIPFMETAYAFVVNTCGNIFTGFAAKNEVKIKRYTPIFGISICNPSLYYTYKTDIIFIFLTNIIQDSAIIDDSPPNVSFIKKARKSGYVGYREYRTVKLDTLQ